MTPASPAPLRTGCWSFTAGADLRANAAAIRRGLAAARRAGVQVLLTPECALTGYPGPAGGGNARLDLVGIDWCQVGDLEDTLLTEAAQAGIALVLGSAGPVGCQGLPGGGGPSGPERSGGAAPAFPSAWGGEADPSGLAGTPATLGTLPECMGNVATGIANEAVTIPGRYRKRRLTPGDTAHFTAGRESVVVDLAGWRCGLAICFDLRFPRVWRDLAEAGADVILVLAHMAGPDSDPGVKRALIPGFCAVRAAEWATPLVFCNTSAPDRWLGSAVWDARGVMTHRRESSGEHLLVAEVRPRTAFAPWYADLRRASLEDAAVSSDPARAGR